MELIYIDNQTIKLVTCRKGKKKKKRIAFLTFTNTFPKIGNVGFSELNNNKGGIAITLDVIYGIK